MELQMKLPNHYIELQQEEMMYLEGGGWIAWAFALTGGVAASVAGAITGAAAAYSAGHMSAYDFGRMLEKKFFGWY